MSTRLYNLLLSSQGDEIDMHFCRVTVLALLAVQMQSTAPFTKFRTVLMIDSRTSDSEKRKMQKWARLTI